MVSNITSLQMVITRSWSYEAANGQTAGFSNVAGADYTTSYNQGSNVQSVSYNAQSSNSNVEAVSAPTYHNYSTSTTSKFSEIKQW